MAFGDRKGWDAKVEGRVIDKKPSSPPPGKTSNTSLETYLSQLPPAAEVLPAPTPPPAPPEPTPEAPEVYEAPPARPIRYHSTKNKLSPGLHVLRIGGELTDEALKRITDFITQELRAQQY